MLVTLTIIENPNGEKAGKSRSFSTQVDIPVIPRRGETIQLMWERGGAQGSPYLHVMDVVYYPLNRRMRRKESGTADTLDVQIFLDGSSRCLEDGDIDGIIDPKNLFILGTWTQGTSTYGTAWKGKN